MIRELHVEGLNDEHNIDLVFNDNINLLTGDNGCGKTTILKILWYLISPNVERAFSEIEFSSIAMQCDSYSLELSKKEMRAIYIPIDGDSIEIENRFRVKGTTKRGNRFPTRFERDLEDINDAIRKLNGASLFFPTYRRIEERRDVGHGEFDRLDLALNRLVSSISVDNHKLIASLSTQDIKNLITERYADCSDHALRKKEELLNEIVADINEIKSCGVIQPNSAVNVLQQLVCKIEQANQEQENIFRPFSSMQEILSLFINDKTVQINKNLSLGELDRVISSEKLSSGEKQLLSFLAYNAFYTETLILIDEPELSLHPDWQRMLIPALESQMSNNQLIMATHSPFIYSKYPEAELIIGNH